MSEPPLILVAEPAAEGSSSGFPREPDGPKETPLGAAGIIGFRARQVHTDLSRQPQTQLALDTFNEVEQKAHGFCQEPVKTENLGRLMTLTAPAGDVMTPAQAMMVIVPKDDALVVEAFLENRGIGFVNAGQTAEIKIETFPFSKCGTIPASLTHVAHDAINDEKRGLIYSTQASLQRATVQVEDKTVNLSAGMVVTMEIKTGSRRVIEYFLSPLLQYGSESLRER
jgi:hemolysin D